MNSVNKKKVYVYLLLFYLFTINYNLYTSLLYFMKLPITYKIMKFLFIASFILMLCLNLHKLYIEFKRKNSLSRIVFYLIILFTLKLVYVILFQLINGTNSPFPLTITTMVKVLINLFNLLLIYVNMPLIISNKNYIFIYFLGMILPTIISLVKFPRLINNRETMIGGVNFIGGFWNSSVIVLSSFGWIALILANFTENKKDKLLFYIFWSISFIGSLAGLSRGSFISLIVSIIIFLIIYTSSGNKINLKVLVVAIISIIIVVKINPNVFVSFYKRFSRMLDINNLKNERRIKIWKEYILDWKRYILIGYYDFRYLKRIDLPNPHNFFLNYSIRVGVLSFVFWLRFYKEILKLFFKKDDLIISSLAFAGVINIIFISLINQTGFIEAQYYVSLAVYMNLYYFLRDMKCLDFIES